jgi:hypothetical protein
MILRAKCATGVIALVLIGASAAASPAPELLAALPSLVLFLCDHYIANCDPLLIHVDGGCHLFFSYSDISVIRINPSHKPYDKASRKGVCAGP